MVDITRYGLASAPATRYSTRWLSRSPHGMRNATVRLLCPQEAWVGTYMPGWKRRYEFIFGASNAIDAGIRSIIPASTRFNNAESSPSASASTFSPLLFRILMWICIPLPACSS
ncbi:hypothetical protein D3C81_1957720 [compost metagenome]